jgi:hypothetical protein
LPERHVVERADPGLQQEELTAGDAGMGPRLRRSAWAPVGAALALLGAGAALLPAGYERSLQARALGQVAPVNEGAVDAADISSNNSPTVVRSPRDPRRLVIANRIDTPRYSCALRVSADGGASWTQVPVPAPKGERECYAPDAAFGADGTLYASFVTLRGGGHVPNAAWIVTSQDGGRTLSEPKRVLGRLAFQVRLATDPRAPRRVYLTWVQGSEVGLYRFSGSAAPIRTMRSEDGGATWSAPVQASSAQRRRVLAPASAVGPAGELYVLYLDLGDDRIDYEGGHQGRGGPPYPGAWQLVLARSRDRGATWQESVVERRLVPTERLIAFIPPFPSLAIDQRSGRLYAAFHDGRLGDADVWVWTLGPGATTWRGPVRVNDTPRRDRTSQYLPRLAVAPDGRLDVLYYDRRRDPRNERNEVSLQSSTDEGQSFTGRLALSGRSFDSKVGFGGERGLPDLGSRLGLVSDDARALAVWPDTRAGTRVSLKQDLARRVVSFSSSEPLGSGAVVALRAGGGVLLLAGLALLGLAVLRRGPFREHEQRNRSDPKVAA